MKQSSASSMRRNSWRWLATTAIIGGLVGGITWAGHQSHTAAPDGRLQIVAAENSWGDLAAQIGADHVQVTSIIHDPQADPHLYEANARTASLIAGADVVITNGLGYDDFMTKLLAAAPAPKRRLITAARVLQAPAAANPHLWYDLPRATVMTTAIAAELSAADPAHAADYQRNEQQLETQLAAVLATIRQIKTHYEGAPVAYTERVPEYLVQAAGLTVQTPPSFTTAIEDGNDPGPADTAAMERLITTHAIRTLLYNPQAASPATARMRALALQSGVPIVVITETMPPAAASFQAWQQAQATALLNALQP